MGNGNRSDRGRRCANQRRRAEWRIGLRLHECGASAAKGISTYQVVLVPQYTSATLGALTAASWNGTSGGIIALDVAGQLNLGGATIHADGVGFRGGAGMQLSGNAAGANTDYQFPGPANYTGAAEAGADAPKGEGVAGTSKFVEYNGTYLRTIAGLAIPAAQPVPTAVWRTVLRAMLVAEELILILQPTIRTQAEAVARTAERGLRRRLVEYEPESGGEGGSPFPATIDRSRWAAVEAQEQETTLMATTWPAADRPAAASSLFVRTALPGRRR